MDSATMAYRGWSDHVSDVCLTLAMVTMTSLTQLGLMGAQQHIMTLPSLHLTMRTIACAVVPVLCAVERAGEKSCCIPAV